MFSDPAEKIRLYHLGAVQETCTEVVLTRWGFRGIRRKHTERQQQQAHTVGTAAWSEHWKLDQVSTGSALSSRIRSSRKMSFNDGHWRQQGGSCVFCFIHLTLYNLSLHFSALLNYHFKWINKVVLQKALDMIQVAYEPPFCFLFCVSIIEVHTYSFDLMFNYFLRINSQVGTD